MSLCVTGSSYDRLRALCVSAFALLIFHAVAAPAQGGPPFRTDDPKTPGNQHWEINFGFIGDRNPMAGAYQVPDFDINFGLGDRIQLKYELPIAIELDRLHWPSGLAPKGACNPAGGAKASRRKQAVSDNLNAFCALCIFCGPPTTRYVAYPTQAAAEERSIRSMPKDNFIQQRILSQQESVWQQVLTKIPCSSI